MWPIPFGPLKSWLGTHGTHPWSLWSQTFYRDPLHRSSLSCWCSGTPVRPLPFSKAYSHLCRQDGASREPWALPHARLNSQLALLHHSATMLDRELSRGQGSPRSQQPPLGLFLGSCPKPQNGRYLNTYMNVPTLPLAQVWESRSEENASGLDSFLSLSKLKKCWKVQAYYFSILSLAHLRLQDGDHQLLICSRRALWNLDISSLSP